MMIRNKYPSSSIYHLCNKSIANFKIFRDEIFTSRFITTLDYYNRKKIKRSLSDYLKSKEYIVENLLYPTDSLVKFLAYCIMPDHYHLLVKINAENSLSRYLNNVENSFTRFFNLKNYRKGPLWQSRFKSVLIESNEQLLHVTRYIHLNPTSSRLVTTPEDWNFSSYRDYINGNQFLNEILVEVSIKNPVIYKKFVDDQSDYQKRLKSLKKLLLD